METVTFILTLNETASCKTQKHPQTSQTTHKPAKNQPNHPQTIQKPAKPLTNQSNIRQNTQKPVNYEQKIGLLPKT